MAFKNIFLKTECIQLNSFVLEDEDVAGGGRSNKKWQNLRLGFLGQLRIIWSWWWSHKIARGGVTRIFAYMCFNCKLLFHFYVLINYDKIKWECTLCDIFVVLVTFYMELCREHFVAFLKFGNSRWVEMYFKLIFEIYNVWFMPSVQDGNYCTARYVDGNRPSATFF